ncbi:MAG: hypothetical protein PHE49_09425 [bacterium]|nr:hypothetical protein [bacterium]
MWEKLLNLDRRWIFLITAICVIIPFLFPIGFPTNVTPPTQQIYDKIDNTKPNGPAVIVTFESDASVLPELYPMATAIVKHCFIKNVRVILMSLGMQGVGIMQMVLEDVKKEFPDKKSGIDYVLMPYVPGSGIVIMRMGEDIHKIYNVDYYGVPMDSLLMMKEIRNFSQVSLVVALAGSGAWASWVVYANQRYGASVAAGVTAVAAPDAYPFLQTHQIIGLLSGLKGAAEYETLVEDNLNFKTKKVACIGMDTQSIIHIVMIIFIILGNIAYFVVRRQKKNVS